MKDSIINFHVNPSSTSGNSGTADFVHPFSCKIMGPRGSGKTSFTVSYIQQIAYLTFTKIYIVTASPDQPLYSQLKDNCQILFISFEELQAVIKSSKDILVVLDDMMKETRFDRTIEALYTRGRHQRISVISLEQDMFYSNCVERRNVDYFILTRIRDESCLQEFYKRYCRDVQQWRFIELYELAVRPSLGYIIIDFVNHEFKYRINSLNMYYNREHYNLRYIWGPSDRALEDLNCQLKGNFKSFISNKKSNYPPLSNTSGNEEHLLLQVDDQGIPINSTFPTRPKCPLCKVCMPEGDKPNWLRESLRAHMETVHHIKCNNSGGLTCGFCELNFDTFGSVVHHIDQDHQSTVSVDDVN